MPLTAKNDTTGKPVDWWFAYKLPQMENPQDHAGAVVGEAKGTEYLYCDADSPALPTALSENAEILKSGALVNTLKQLHDAAAKKDPNIGWFFYNDEHTKVNKKPIPGVPKDNENYGHTKGVLAFDLKTDSAFWILHSWPCFPSIEPVDPPSPEKGQTYLCITLPDVATADAIAGVFVRQTQPQIIGMNVPGSLNAKKYQSLATLAQTAPEARAKGARFPAGAVVPEDHPFTSKAGGKFRFFAKSKDWEVPAHTKGEKDKDLYSDLIGPKLEVDLEVETWQDGEPHEDSDRIHTTDDIQWIDLRKLSPKLDFAWHFLNHDHAKWAVAKDPALAKETDWVIVADINRIQTQFNRGGGGIAFQNRPLARGLHKILQMIPPPEDEAVIEGNRKKAAAKKKPATSAAKKTK